jgi:hypothetical protein
LQGKAYSSSSYVGKASTYKPRGPLILLDLAKKWDFEIPLAEAQNLMGEILEECVGDLEKCWWENGTPKLFSPDLITLAEKLGFNVERYSKITGPSNLAGQS